MTPLPPPPSSSDPANFNSRADAFLAALPQFVTEANALGTPGLGGGTMLAALEYTAPVTVASASTCDIGAAASNEVIISGSVGITNFGTGLSKYRMVRFTGSPLITYNASSLITPTLANIQAAVGDCAVLISDSSGNWRIIDYLAAGGVKLATFSAVNLAAAYAQITSLSLTPGKWRITAHANIVAAVSATYFKIAISTTTASNAGTTSGVSEVSGSISAVPIGACSIVGMDVTLTATTTYFMNMLGNGTGTGALDGHFRAERII